jgi:4-amino-4-deoxy-L-arabinose transferase-like glycosyltransferase
MIDDRRTQRFVLSALFIFYVAARLWRLTDTCLWFDEIFSVHAAEHDWSSILWFVARDLIHPPLFYIILKIWTAIGGEGLFWLRLLPVGFASLAIFPFVLFCRELKLKFPAIGFALFLLALNGSFIRYAQSVRMYSMLTFVSLVSLWLFARYFNRGKNLVALIVVNVILVYTHYYGWMLVGAEIGAILIFQRIKWRGMAAMFGSTFALFVPWLWFVWKASQSGSELGQNIKWIARPGFTDIGTFVIDLVEPVFFQLSSVEPASIYTVSIPILLILVISVAVYISGWKNREAEEKRPVYFLLLFVFLPVVAVFAASWVMPYSIWGTRHLIIIVGPLTLLFSIVVTESRPPIVRTTAILLIALFSGYALALESVRPKQIHVWCAWEGLATDVRSSVPQDETANIYTFENLTAYHVWFALRNSPNTSVSVIGGYEDALTLEMYFLPRGFDEVKTVDINDVNDESFWMLFRTQKPGEQSAAMDALRSKGYFECPSTPIKYGSTNIFKFQMVKDEARCVK